MSKPSLVSAIVSPATGMLKILRVSPGASVTVPVGNTPPGKSVASTE
jgi:hypothetical protein